jgi:hypothetical protein
MDMDTLIPGHKEKKKGFFQRAKEGLGRKAKKIGKGIKKNIKQEWKERQEDRRTLKKAYRKLTIQEKIRGKRRELRGRYSPTQNNPFNDRRDVFSNDMKGKGAFENSANEKSDRFSNDQRGKGLFERY